VSNRVKWLGLVLCVVLVCFVVGCKTHRVSWKVEAFGVSFGMAFSPSRVAILDTNTVLTAVTNNFR
jgi:hypothetical protein